MRKLNEVQWSVLGKNDPRDSAGKLIEKVNFNANTGVWSRDVSNNERTKGH